MKNISLKARLIGLLLVALLAMLMVGITGWLGLEKTSESVMEIGKVRLPSVLGLELINEGQTAVRSNNRSVAFFENDYKAQAEFAKVIKNREEVWKRIDEGWKLYEPLPQSKEEAELWTQFVREWDDWKASDEKIDETISALGSNADEEQQNLFIDRIRFTDM